MNHRVKGVFFPRISSFLLLDANRRATLLTPHTRLERIPAPGDGETIDTSHAVRGNWLESMIPGVAVETREHQRRLAVLVSDLDVTASIDCGLEALIISLPGSLPHRLASVRLVVAQVPPRKLPVLQWDRNS
jgi:hypothetical protein